MAQTDTIVAQATATGRGGVGIVRVSGPLAHEIGTKMTGRDLAPRRADYLPFLDQEGQPIDQGIALFFKGPHSFTGEDVLELQGHGGPVIMDMLIQRISAFSGVRAARPGEFSERAFLNDKLDLAQAEAIADLIDASSEQAARSALQSLQGAFSSQVNALVEKVIHLRIYVEAAIDFPDEEIDFLSDGKVASDLSQIIEHLATLRKEANQGAIMREGMKVVIAGRPNAGKSSLLNALSGKDSAIVTDIAGTTRDVLREHIHIDGMPLHIIDTAGLRDTADEVERIGVERAWDEIEQADRVLFMVDGTTTDATHPAEIWPDFVSRLPKAMGMTVIRNKVDMTGEPMGHDSNHDPALIRLSAKTGEGMDALRQHLKACMGYAGGSEGGFMARRRHLDALANAAHHLDIGQAQLEGYMAGEILAEELRLTQQHLNTITGEFSADDLLGKIFSSFCIGK
ncbi:tRNA uridine-5-carboxymethylaminomethyl(34) synthesis GTPase MnmE [Salinivibrio sp. IB868]|uniref:tRNA uridine-5-carboxymethylaminomethyl(34) synthesis GTPase MnmE n=1 Tax=unclassified Salinivibrio TaxID=2636825 RepID=UPI0009865D1F|nr:MULTISPECIES: tRNA uridine-5-carboxymethylaminomethyl(34) synthesis GTPase MnmE [unclassified Salinivibrio]OOE64859.1 tRNA uridine-5-carboxymethylaminomethyl(34) synthesis GTPase MnmE [Salinivibrio sp. IB868]OOE71250.1 tRNA uridine-5-carboxymethylaminomethyl(34) synthesis GTPase MnmE [Salinivibrio sp. IB870]OOE72489.1 tRNA uridine-5-carboxymethylaminomethyl(34) synthesis GTPase MnmE [Salinivibrio sp. ML290]